MSMSRAIDPFDELAAMFLTAPQAKAPTAVVNGGAPSKAVPGRGLGAERSSSRHASHEPEIELLIVGHLPVRAGLWLTPYADAVGRHRGATALLRLDSDEPTLHLLRAAGKAEAGTTRPMLKPTLLDLASVVDCWIVRAPAGTGMEQCAALPVDRITILTSGDEAAIFAAYQIIKDLAQAGAKDESQGLESALRAIPRVGLAVVGVDQQTAIGVVERVNRTTVSFLGVEVSLAMFLPRMDPGIKSTQFLTFADQSCPTLAEVTSWLAQAKALAVTMLEPSPIAGKLHADRGDARVSDAAQILGESELLAGVPQVIVPPRSKPRSDRSEIFQPSDDLDDVALSPSTAHPSPDAPWSAAPRAAAINPIGFRTTPAKSAPPPRPVVVVPLTKSPQPFTNWAPVPGIAGLPRAAPPPQSPATQPANGHGAPKPVKLAPKPAINYEIKHPSTALEPVADGKPVLLSTYVEGLTTLPVHSPGHERVELAVDAAGRLHLLGREQTLREMRLVESWARAHRELIAMACPQHPIDQGAKAVCHIFSAEPVALADLHGADLRLHVLAPVQVNGHTAWYAAQLNT